MKNKINVTTPEFISILPQQDGYPVPFFVAPEKNGRYDFRLADPAKKLRCNKERRCWICGQKLESVVCFVGGPYSIRKQTFGDGPMHQDCAEYALRVCPYLAVTERERREVKDDAGVNMPGHVLEKPPKFGLYFTDNWIISPTPLGFYFLPNIPLEIRWFKEGKQITV